MMVIDDADMDVVPVMRVHLRGAATMADSERLFDRIARLGEGRRCLIWDSTHAGMPSMEVLKRWIRWSNENADLTRRTCVGIVHVIPSPAVRGALKFCMKLAPSPCPTWVVRNLEEAEAKACEALVAAGLTTPETYRAHREARDDADEMTG